MTKALTNDTYDARLLEKGIKYTRVSDYINSRTKITHLCPKCGQTWLATPANILQGMGCSSCNGKTRYTNKTYDAKLLEKGIKYKRVGTYDTAHVPIEHECYKCSHIWLVSPSNILTGGGCPLCSRLKNTLTNEVYDARLLVKGIKYKRLGDYKNAQTPIEHECLTCGYIWSPRPYHILNGSGCPSCAGLAKYTNDTYDLKLLEKNIKYKRVENYTNSKEKIKHICPICSNIWEVRPNDIQNGIGCPICASSTPYSKGEKDLLEYIISLYSGWLEVNNRSILNGKELDIVLPDKGIAFEYNGIYWHREEVKGKDYHLNKTLGTEAFEYQLIHINEDEWEYKQPIVKSRIKSLLGLSNRIYARKCNIKEISSEEANFFLNSNHIQGTCYSSIRLGLYYDSTLVALMTFGNSRFNNSYDYELLRYCSILNTTVIGGASKLLKAFRSTNIGTIISYADRRWSKGNLYKSLGFKFLHNSEPNYRYHKKEESLSRYQCQKHKLVEMGFDKNKTETEIMTERGYYKVYDCGNSVWVLE